MKRFVPFLGLLILSVASPAFAKHHKSGSTDPTLDPVTCGTGAVLAVGSTDTAGAFTNDATTQDSSQTCALTIPGTTPRRCSAMRYSNPLVGETMPLPCEIIINATDTTMLITGTGPSNVPASYDDTITYESSTY